MEERDVMHLPIYVLREQMGVKSLREIQVQEAVKPLIEMQTAIALVCGRAGVMVLIRMLLVDLSRCLWGKVEWIIETEILGFLATMIELGSVVETIVLLIMGGHLMSDRGGIVQPFHIVKWHKH
jgi:hypothetical protein